MKANHGLGCVIKCVASRSTKVITVVRPHLEYCIQFFSLPVLEQVQQKTIRMHRGLKDMSYKKKIGWGKKGGGKHLIALLSYIKGDYRENWFRLFSEVKSTKDKRQQSEVVARETLFLRAKVSLGNWFNTRTRSCPEMWWNLHPWSFWKYWVDKLNNLI